MADYQAQVADLLAEYRRSREQLASVHQQLTAISESATSEDGTVTATVSAQGALTGLVIADAAYRDLRPAELAAVIVRTTAAAAARATRLAGQVVAPVLPPGADPEALLRGTADLTPAEIRPPKPAGDGEDSFENVTWMEPGGKKR